MKNFISFLICFLFIETLFGQILVRNENWPNPNWTVIGTYTSAALLSNPTINTEFKYDFSLVTSPEVKTLIEIDSPFFSLQPAFDGNEKLLKISFNIAFLTFETNALYFQFWDADTSSWVLFPEGSAPTINLGDYKTCTFDPIDSLAEGYLDYSSFSTNQLQNFRYRFVIDGTSKQIAGVCLNNVKLISFSCLNPPSNLFVSEVTNNAVIINWDYDASQLSNWDYEYGIHGFELGTGNFHRIGVQYNPPLTLYELSPNTSYDFYIRKNCSNSEILDIVTDWAGPLTFTTTNLGVNTFNFDSIKLFPNPTHGLLELNSINSINEIKIYNLTGQELFDKKINDSHPSIDLSGFNSGLYLIKIITVKGTRVYKVVKD